MKKEEKKNCTAIVLSAGQGKRMGTSVQKQYIELQGKPIIYYTLAVFQKSEIIDEMCIRDRCAHHIYKNIISCKGLRSKL